jgi:SagB-type dehydrogenase family enzyme
LSASLLLSWSEGVSVEIDPCGTVRVQGPQGRIAFRQLPLPLCNALERLMPPGAEEEWLTESMRDTEGTALAGWYYTLKKLTRCGFICRSVHAESQCLATLLPISPSFVLNSPPLCGKDPFFLSRFAYLRRQENAMVLESPSAFARVLLATEALPLIGALAKPATAEELAARSHPLSVESISLLLSLLAEAGMLQDGESETPALASWEFHDLVFHTRSRKGRCDAAFGATYRMAGIVEPLAALKPDVLADTCDLYRPDLEELRRDDPPFADIVENRRSLRDYGEQPITARQLGEFLYRVARVKDCREIEWATPSGPVPMEFVSRPYPSGGALYELEFYVAVRNCDGLSPGLYHYQGQHHRLARLREKTDAVEQLLSDAAASAAIPAESVQLLFILAARFPRLSWKYSSIAYALILKHVGVVYQTMYLTATAMQLAACALGGGDADLFARAAGTDYYEETSVGEFLLGSAPPSDSPDRANR